LRARARAGRRRRAGGPRGRRAARDHPGRETALACAPDATVTGDPERLVQLLSNLVGNAVTHGTQATAIAVSVVERRDDIVVEVRNRGAIAAGAPPDAVRAVPPGRSRGAAVVGAW